MRHTLYMTVTRVWPLEDGEDYPREDHGWMDDAWGDAIFASREDVNPFAEIDDDELSDDGITVTEWIKSHTQFHEDNGDGTYYAMDPRGETRESLELGYTDTTALHYYAEETV